MRIDIGEKLTIKEIINMTDGKAHNIGSLLDCKIDGITLDSREIQPKDMFIALKGERVDGHSYICAAQKAGAFCALAEYTPDDCNLPLIIVDDTLAALGKLASEYKKRFNIISVAVTGSVGKTTTKEMIYSTLSLKYKTYKTAGNYNSLSGLPMSVMELDSTYSATVFELGMSSRGEISRLSKIICPDIAVITNIGVSHIQYLGSRESIRDAKLEIAEGISDNGTIILNGDEVLLDNVKNAVYFSALRMNAEYLASNIRSGDDKLTFDAVTPNGQIKDITLAVSGRHSIMNALAAVAVAQTAGVCATEIKRGLSSFRNLSRRQNIYIKDSYTVIDDCYNAAPESMAAAIEVLADISKRKSARSVAVLGEMRELGEMTPQLHKDVGKLITQFGIEFLITVGEAAVYIAEEAKSNGMDKNKVITFNDINAVDEIANALKVALKPGDMILFKASNGVALDRVIDRAGLNK